MKVALQRRPSTVAREIAERKRQFRKALALAEMTAAAWAEEYGVGAAYLSRYLAGQAVSRPLGEAIDTFIAKHFRKVG